MPTRGGVTVRPATYTWPGTAFSWFPRVGAGRMMVFCNVTSCTRGEPPDSRHARFHATMPASREVHVSQRLYVEVQFVPHRDLVEREREAQPRRRDERVVIDPGLDDSYRVVDRARDSTW